MRMDDGARSMPVSLPLCVCVSVRLCVCVGVSLSVCLCVCASVRLCECHRCHCILALRTSTCEALVRVAPAHLLEPVDRRRVGLAVSVLSLPVSLSVSLSLPLESVDLRRVGLEHGLELLLCRTLRQRQW